MPHPFEDEAVEPNPEIEARFDPFAPYTSDDALQEFEKSGDDVSTGFKALDDQDFLFRPGKLYAVIARPSEGKTTLMLELAMRRVEMLANQEVEGGPVVFVTYEEMRREIYLKMLLREVAKMDTDSSRWVFRKSAEKWLLGDGDAFRPEALAHAASVLDDHAKAGRLSIVDGDHGNGLDVNSLTEALRDAQTRAGRPPSLVVVDYYQKISPPHEEWGAPRYLQLQAVADRLRRYAKPDDPEWAVPVLTGAQVSRGGAEDGMPDLAGVREADDLANDAAGVLALHLPREAEGQRSDTRTLKVRIVKNRDGKKDGEVEMRFHGGVSWVREKPSNGSPVVEQTGFSMPRRLQR
jgi:replicative DNA helicase